MGFFNYERERAVIYAHKYAYGRNSRYYDFSAIGGDCTNFVSQAIFEGCGVMDYRYPMGWYYKNANDKAPAWTGAKELYNFLTGQNLRGPYGKECELKDIEPGDIVQLKFSDKPYFSHTAIIVAVHGRQSYNDVLVSAHTYDTDNKRLSLYEFEKARFVSISGAKI